MAFFCQDCATKPGWSFEVELAQHRSCNRCFQHRPCNEYGAKPPGPTHLGAQMKSTQGYNPQAEVKLPAPGPRVPVPPPAPKAIEAVSTDGQTEADKALDAVYPNRPRIKLEVIKKGGGKV